MLQSGDLSRRFAAGRVGGRHSREKARFCQLVFERIWVDLDTGLVEAVKPRPAFRRIVAQIVHATQMLWPGDPERIRTADLHLDRVAC